MRKDDSPRDEERRFASKKAELDILVVELRGEVGAAVTVPAGASNGVITDQNGDWVASRCRRVVQSIQDIVGCPAVWHCTRCLHGSTNWMGPQDCTSTGKQLFSTCEL